MNESKLAIAIKTAAERLKVSSVLMSEYAEEPENLLAAIVDQSEARLDVIREQRTAIAVCMRELQRAQQRELEVGRRCMGNENLGKLF